MGGGCEGRERAICPRLRATHQDSDTILPLFRHHPQNYSSAVSRHVTCEQELTGGLSHLLVSLCVQSLMPPASTSSKAGHARTRTAGAPYSTLCPFSLK